MSKPDKSQLSLQKSVTSEHNFSHKEIIEFFDRPHDVNMPWLFQMRLNKQKVLDSRDPMNQIVYDNFDDIQCICLEIQYQKFLRSNKSEMYRYVKLNRQFTVDLKQLIEFRDDNPQDYRIIMRGDTKKRPQGSDRLTSQLSFTQVPAHEQATAPAKQASDPLNPSQRAKGPSSGGQPSAASLNSNNWLAEQWRAQSK